MDMKKRISVLIVALALCLTLFFTACNTYTSSLVFYETQENDEIGYGENEAVVIENTDPNITKLLIPSAYNDKPVTTIWNNVFHGCEFLLEINLPDSLLYIEWGAFSGCSQLSEIILPNSLMYIGWTVFEGDVSLISLTIGKNLVSIGGNAFKNCSNLKDVYYGGTQEDWDKIEILEGNECLLNATIHFEN